jgi:hypothetical protein
MQKLRRFFHNSTGYLLFKHTYFAPLNPGPGGHMVTLECYLDAVEKTTVSYQY